MAKLQPGHGVGPCLQASRSRSPHLGVVRHDRREGLKWLDRDKQVHELGFCVGWHRVPKHPDAHPTKPHSSSPVAAACPSWSGLSLDSVSPFLDSGLQTVSPRGLLWRWRRVLSDLSLLEAHLVSVSTGWISVAAMRAAGWQSPFLPGTRPRNHCSFSGRKRVPGASLGLVRGLGAVVTVLACASAASSGLTANLLSENLPVAGTDISKINFLLDIGHRFKTDFQATRKTVLLVPNTII